MLASLFLLASTALTTAFATPTARDAGTDLLIADLLRLDAAINTITYAAGNYTGGVAA